MRDAKSRFSAAPQWFSFCGMGFLRDLFSAFRRKASVTAGQIGVRGERQAERLLRDKGYRLLERNWRSGRDEIDLICLDASILVFVEVRSRARGALVGGFDSISSKKRAALRRVCRAYLAKAKPKPLTTRFDVVEIEHVGGEAREMRHFENVPLFSKPANREV